MWGPFDLYIYTPTVIPTALPTVLTIPSRVIYLRVASLYGRPLYNTGLPYELDKAGDLLRATENLLLKSVFCSTPSTGGAHRYNSITLVHTSDRPSNTHLWPRPFKADTDIFPIVHKTTYVAHVGGWEPYNLHDLQQHMFPGLGLYLECRSCTTSHNSRVMNYDRWSRSWPIWHVPGVQIVDYCHKHPQPAVEFLVGAMYAPCTRFPFGRGVTQGWRL